MRKQQDSQGNFDMQRAMEFAGTPAGQRLIALLQAQNGEDLQKAMALASAGDLQAAKRQLASLLDDPRVRDIMKGSEG